MRESQVIIERVRRVGEHWQHLSLTVEDAALEQIKPGQSLLAESKAYLPERWIPINFDEEQRLLIIEHPNHELYSPGDVVSVMGPVGSPFPMRRGIQRLLLVAQDFAPTRLLFAMFRALQHGVAVTLVLTGDARNYPITTLPPTVEVIHSEDIISWSSQGQLLTWADQIVVVTEALFWQDRYVPILYAAHQSRPALPEDFLLGVFDLPTPCGTGACMACMVRCHHGNRLACLDGPAFDMANVKLL